MSGCPSAEQLQRFLHERLDDAVCDSISNHVTECSACQAILRALDSGTAEDGELLERLRKVHPLRGGPLHSRLVPRSQVPGLLDRHQF
jgi:hypothetical protein